MYTTHFADEFVYVFVSDKGRAVYVLFPPGGANVGRQQLQ